MTYEKLFRTVKERFSKTDVSRFQEHMAFQINIIGEGEGAFYVEIKDRQLYIEPYEYYDRDAIFICRADTLLKIIFGRLDPRFAYSIRKLKVHGNLEKALKLLRLI